MKFTLPQKLIISFFAVVMVILIVISCKKIDSPPQEKSKDTIAEKFFFIKPDTDPKVAAIAASIKRQNNQRKFIEKLTKNAGFAIWEKAKVISANVNTRSTSEGDCQVFIPFVPENGVQTKALLIVKLSGTDTLYHLMYGTNYKNYGFDRNTTGVWTGREVFSAFAIFDNEIFGHKEFSVKDDRLLGSDVNITNNEPIIAYMKDSVTEQSRIQTVHTFIHTVTWVICGECNGGRSSQNITARTSSFPAPCCNATYYTEVVIFWIDDAAGGGNGPEWGWYPPEGGGGGGGEPCPGCNWDNTNPCEEQDPNEPQVPCDDGWQPVVSAVKEPFHVNEYDDTIGISSGLENVYPCMASFIRDSFTNINSDPNSNVNYLAQLAGANVFGDSAYMHLTFDTSTVFTQPGQAGAETTDTIVTVDPAGNTHYYAKIRFNGWYLRNGTKEYKVARILHEVMHAVFGLRWGQYQVWLNTNPHQGTIDSFFIKSHFPINWYWMTQQNVPLTELQDHEIMGSDYASFFTSIGSRFYNPSAPSYVRDTVLKALGFGGLRQTSVWKMLPSLGIDTCKYRNINLTAAESLIGTYNVSGCASFTTHFADSLKLTPGCH